MKGKRQKGISRTAERQWVTIRVTQAEKLRLTNQAEIAGVSLSEYMRRNFFGGKPLVAHTDLKIFMELRRIGGLLKGNFTVMRLNNAHYELCADMESLFQELRKLILKIGYLFDDS